MDWPDLTTPDAGRLGPPFSGAMRRVLRPSFLAVHGRIGAPDDLFVGDVRAEKRVRPMLGVLGVGREPS